MPLVPLRSSHLTLLERGHLLLHGDVLLLQLAVVLQLPGLSHFVLSDVIAQLTSLQLRQLRVLNESKEGALVTAVEVKGDVSG